MNISFLIQLILLVLIVSSCKSENPTISETGFGKVYVVANVENGEIFIDGEFSGLTTPDTLEYLAVNHLIKVRKEGYFSEEKEVKFQKDKITTENFILSKNELVKNVLFESFTNVDCDNCNNINALFNDLKASYSEKLIIINYPSRFPSQNDPMYLEVSEAVNSRMEFYNILDDPTFLVDGQIRIVNEFNINEEFIKETKLSILVQDSLIQGDGMTIDIFVDVFDLDGFDFNSLVLHTAIIENNIVYESPPGSNGQKEFNYILRTMVPDFEGISLSTIIKKGRAKFVVFKLLNPRFKKENLRVISFIQNKHTKEVLQVGEVE